MRGGTSSTCTPPRSRPLALEACNASRHCTRLRQRSAASHRCPPSARIAQSAPLYQPRRCGNGWRRPRPASRAERTGEGNSYTLSRWQALTWYLLLDGRACIDNNAAERSMRPMVLGRKTGCSPVLIPVDTRLPQPIPLIQTAQAHHSIPRTICVRSSNASPIIRSGACTSSCRGI